MTFSDPDHPIPLSFIPFHEHVDVDEPGNLPNISFIARKPEPLGTEFKTVCDAVTGLMLHLEIQRGKAGMSRLTFADTMIKTAACTARMMDATRRVVQEKNPNTAEESIEDSDSDDSSSGNPHHDIENPTSPPRKEVYYADAWFGSVDSVLAAMDLGVHLVCIVKTCHNRVPKKKIEEIMDPWPAGSHLVLESKIEGKKLYACGYKYNRRKVLTFLFSAGAGHTCKGTPYRAKWKDDNGNTVHKFVDRPDVIARYFANSNAVDMHNQSRQGDLQLEKCWITTDGFFRIGTTLFAMTVVDCWKAYVYHLHHRHRHKTITLIDFVSLMAKDLLTNKMSRTLPYTKEKNKVVPFTDATPFVLPPQNTNHTSSVNRQAGSTSTIDEGTVLTTDLSRLGVPETEKLSQDTFLNAIDLYKSDDEKNSLVAIFKRKEEVELAQKESKNEAFPQQLHELHTIVLNSERTTEMRSVVDKTGRSKNVKSPRRKRGKCLHCGRNTCWYCPACTTTTPTGHLPRARKYWCCGPPAHLTPGGNHLHVMCQRAHEKDWKAKLKQNTADLSDKEQET